ncbi:MAG: hypothetical protein GY838_13995 [bacterium]|nr:hypothetical protein [bacterium]
MLRAVTLVLVFILLSATAHADDDPWTPFHPLAGKWRGQGEGFGSTSQVKHTWEWVTKGAFLALHTDSQGEGEVHEDMGFLSLDRDHDRWMFRQFLSEGFVNTFEVVPGQDNGLPVFDFNFVAAESAGSMKVRMRLVFTSADAYTMTLDLAGKSGEYGTCQTMTMTRFEGEDR